MKKIIFTLCLLAMTGCSSIQDMRNRNPNQTFVSNKSVKNIAECILFEWQENTPRYGSVFIQPYSDGYTVYSESQLEVADIINENNRAKINFYHQGGLFDYRIDNRVKKIKLCI
ncbi:membrane lipoprotein lipid attachment site-containing protein [Xenorhabdus sp. M]|uniref:Membrane lipoprotein lipid attachment site-containing protein n=1 Tax=Xenorhabdus szentirmaii TaxID=290112 RepID=A0AAW3YT83_9GAMM|nr:hypothetical protein [Xenorhabdus sp. M]MBD2800742.1 membrane lipoprotein lipid attachment site-containing protein [Xenorhabdus sp. M]